MEGEYWISRASVGHLVGAVRRLLGHSVEGQSRKPHITPRQQEIIASVAAGHSNKQIAQQFSLSEDTVKRHLTNIFGRLGLSNRLELALFAAQQDMTEGGSHA
jgi:DNA-binding NarL/FixJ family response regulator